MQAQPQGVAELDSEWEWQGLQEALAELELQDLVQLKKIPATLSALHQALEDDDYHIVHFIGHGSFDRAEAVGKLYFEKEDGSIREVKSDMLGTILQDHESLRLVFLNSCKGAVNGLAHPFAGIAQRLVRRGIAASLAMQARISDDAAKLFAKSVYRSLARGGTLDQALLQGRKMIYGEYGHDYGPEWATPVLFCRSENLRLFDIPDYDEAQVLNNLRKRADAALATGDAEKAATLYSRLLENVIKAKPEDHDEAEIQTKLAEAKRQVEVGQAYQKGLFHDDQGQWTQAISYFEQVRKLDEDYKDTNSRLLTAKAREREEHQRTQGIAGVSAGQAGLDDEALDKHLDALIEDFKYDRVVPVFGADINLALRQRGVVWEVGQKDYLPNRKELSNYLAESFAYQEDNQNLARVAQFAYASDGIFPVYEELGKIYQQDYPASTFHRFYAALQQTLLTKGYQTNPLITLTTNYDDVLVRQYRQEGIAYDLLYLKSLDDGRARFFHNHFDGTELHKAVPIEKPNEYDDLDPETRATIVQLHGMVQERRQDNSFLITEDQYLNSLTFSEEGNLLPTLIQSELAFRRFLFLGLDLSDWNIRCILQPVLGKQARINKYRSWVVQQEISPFEEKLWDEYRVELLSVPLDHYIMRLQEKFEQL